MIINNYKPILYVFFKQSKMFDYDKIDYDFRN